VPARADVRALAARADVRAALADASPDLAAAIDRGWTPKVEAAVGRYLLRMAGRPAPFGALAGVSVGALGEATRLEVGADVVRREAVLAGDETPAANPLARRGSGGVHAIEGFGWTAGPEAATVARAVEARHADGARAAPGLTLGAETADRLAAAAELLCALTPDRPPPVIARFARRFTERYGDTEVPLLEALDPEDGLGLAPPPPELEWTARERRLLDAVASRDDVWDLGADDLAVLAPERPRPLPAAFAVLATLLEDGVRVHGVSGPSGARLIARHATGDPELAALLREHARVEESLDPEAIHAEVRFRPEHPGERAVLAAPEDLREHVIDLTGGASTIPPAELMVHIDAGRPVLTWEGRRVAPRLSSAHAYHDHPHDVYRFLGHLQDPHGDGWIRWSWGPLATAGRLPRVRRDDLVLAPAITRGPASGRVLLSERGRELPLDLDSPLAAAALGDGPHAFLEDLPLTPVRSPRGTHRHDLIVPFTAPVAAPSQALAPRAPAVFKPGSEWNTVELYCGAVAADALLLDAVRPALDGAEWFFLRYPEPEWHLRVRLRGDPAPLLALAGDERVWRAQLTTYVPEAARYGDIGAAERCFCADSAAVCDLLAAGPGHTERVHLAAAGVALLLADAADPPRFRPPQGRGTRADRDAVRALVAEPPAPLLARSERWGDDVRRLGAQAVASLAHMHVNRLLREAVPDLEAAVYDLLPLSSSAPRSSARSSP
jgi:hypothetical protein